MVPCFGFIIRNEPARPSYYESLQGKHLFEYWNINCHIQEYHCCRTLHVGMPTAGTYCNYIIQHLFCSRLYFLILFNKWSASRTVYYRWKKISANKFDYFLFYFLNWRFLDKDFELVLNVINRKVKSASQWLSLINLIE